MPIFCAQKIHTPKHPSTQAHTSAHSKRKEERKKMSSIAYKVLVVIVILCTKMQRCRTSKARANRFG